MTTKELRNQAREGQYITVAQFAALIQYHKRSVYRLIQRGTLPGVIRVTGSRTVRIDKEVALKGLPPRPPKDLDAYTPPTTSPGGPKPHVPVGTAVHH